MMSGNEGGSRRSSLEMENGSEGEEDEGGGRTPGMGGDLVAEEDETDSAVASHEHISADVRDVEVGESSEPVGVTGRGSGTAEGSTA